MFHWICPECGREIAPTVRECPACDAGAEQAELVLAGVVEASARALNVEPSTRTAHDDAPVVDRNRAVDWKRTGARSAPAPDEDPRSSVSPANGTSSPNLIEPPAAEPAVALRSLGTAIEASPESSQPAPAAPLIPEILDAKAAEARAIEAKAADLLGVRAGAPPAREAQEAGAPEAWETRAVESKAVPTRTVESKAVETRSVDSKVVETKAVETKAVETRTLESKPVESKAAESSVVKSQVVESKVAERTVVEPRALPPAEPKETGTGEQPVRESIEEEPRQAASPVAPPAMPDPAEPVPSLAKFGRLTPPYGNSVASTAESTRVVPHAAAPEPVLPSLVPPAPESLNALLAAAGMLDDEPQAEPPDPPLAARLPLPLGSARLTPAAPAAPASPALKAQTAPPPEAAYERRIAGLAPAQSPLPLGPISARRMKAAAISPPTALPPKSVGVRAPRSPRPFLAPAMASLLKYSPLENHPLRPAPPPEDLHRTQTAPRFTLPGPMLTRSLASFQDRALTPVFLEERAFRKRFTSGWLVTVLVVGTVLGVGFSSLFSPHSSTDAHPTAVAERSSPDAASAVDAPDVADKKNPAAAHATGSNPLSKSIEVTGFRVVMDPSRKAEVQYLVVNHSPARFSDATVYVTLHAANARPGQPPLCRFSFAAPNLGPFEAKEMISAIEKTNRPVNLPDWQALRADVTIGP